MMADPCCSRGPLCIPYAKLVMWSIRIAIICDNFSPHLTTARDGRVGIWTAANDVEIAYAPSNSTWLNRAQFTALRYFRGQW